MTYILKEVRRIDWSIKTDHFPELKEERQITNYKWRIET